jgi:HK97 gp10 family phage protein
MDFKLDLKKFEQNFVENIEEEFGHLGEKMKREAQKNCPERTGNLKRSIDVKVLKEKDMVGVDLYCDEKKAPYWSFVEVGTSKQAPAEFLKSGYNLGMKELEQALSDAFKKSGR